MENALCVKISFSTPALPPPPKKKNGGGEGEINKSDFQLVHLREKDQNGRTSVIWSYFGNFCPVGMSEYPFSSLFLKYNRVLCVTLWLSNTMETMLSLVESWSRQVSFCNVSRKLVLTRRFCCVLVKKLVLRRKFCDVLVKKLVLTRRLYDVLVKMPVLTRVLKSRSTRRFCDDLVKKLVLTRFGDVLFFFF